MLIQSTPNKTTKRTAKIVRDERGNVAVMFALALVPMLGFVGAAVDYSRANAARSSMQVAIDSAALMVSKDLGSNPTMSASDVTTKAVAYFNALYTNTNSGPVTVNATYTTNTASGSTVTVTGSGSVTTDFMKMVGYPKLDVGSTSTTTWGSTRMRVAMALDVTGSMADDGKMAAMQSAAKSLVDTLQSNAKNADDVYISVVPFAQMVNVGKSNKSATWITWTDFDTANGSCSNSSYSTQASCVSNNKTWTATSHNNWNGCVTDRDQPYDTTRDAPTSVSTRFPANQYNACPAQILPMTSAYSASNVTTIKAKIDSLSPNGGTNQPIGMAWAWETLQSGDPMSTPAKDSAYKYTDAIIVLSDGQNTIDRWYGNGSSYSASVDARQKILCDNIKATSSSAAPVVIYTIQVNTDNDPESAVLKYCAGAGNFYPTSTASGIAAAFTAIGNSLNALRVSK